MNLWIVGKLKDNGPWEFQGVFNSKEEADAVALSTKDGLCFVGPCTLNQGTGDTLQTWPHSYFPFPKGENN